ncbi:MAG TPA: hypothetical protein VLA13_01570 [Massilibacterium sp.]|nr:hypothetical protein [Massilibacterium sp.]
MRDDKLQEIIELLPYSIRYTGEIEELLDYAREQAERVQELEEAIADYAYEIGKRKRALNKKNEQNKRYREAIDYVMKSEIKHYDSVEQLLADVKYVIEKTLEGEE